MDESYGIFSKRLQLVGILRGDDLVDGRQFTNDGEPFISPRKLEQLVRVGVGNRVNLYVANSISQKTFPPGVPEYGITVGWSFDDSIRTVDQQSVVDPFSGVWQEANLLFDDALSNAWVKKADMNYHYFSFANKAGNPFTTNPDMKPWRVLPLRAVGDLLNVYFYTEPSSYNYGPNDLIAIWALVGHDAQSGGDINCRQDISSS